MSRCRITLLLGLTSLASSCGLAPERAVKREPGTPPSLSPSVPQEAVDHVVTYAWSRWFGPKGGDRITVYRHQSLIREDRQLIGSRRSHEGEFETDFSNLTTGASLSISTSKDGASAVNVWRARRNQAGHKRVATEERRQIAGESCRVWRAIPLAERGVEHRACITNDGVMLQEAALYRDGSPMDERIALKVERRRVRPEEVLPPRNALSWPYWLAKAREKLAASDHRPNYDLRLKQRGDFLGQAGTSRYRASGGWKSVEHGRSDHMIIVYHS